MGLSFKLRRASDGVPPLVEVPKIDDLPQAKLNSAARYLGTVDTEGNRVIGQSLAVKSSARLSLSAEALDVIRIAGSFRIPVGALRGASRAEAFLGKPEPALLLVRWVHEGNDWRTGFRMEASRTVKDAAKKAGGTAVPDVDQWVRTISKLSRGNA